MATAKQQISPEDIGGTKVKLREDRNSWLVQAVSENFVALVQSVPFKPRGTLRYTVLDWRNGVRGPCDLIGRGYGDGSYSRQQCSEMLEEFENALTDDPAKVAALDAGLTSWSPSRGELSVSHRNRLPINIEKIERGL